jgi:hypothetical protein
MALDADTGVVIDLKDARNYVKDYGLKFPDQNKAYFVGRNKIEDILDQSGCMGIRIYNGYVAEDEATNLVLVGVDYDGKDMTDGIILDRLAKCPSICDYTSALMS